jgi:hypothetical protein
MACHKKEKIFRISDTSISYVVCLYIVNCLQTPAVGLTDVFSLLTTRNLQYVTEPFNTTLPSGENSAPSQASSDNLSSLSCLLDQLREDEGANEPRI